MLETRLTAPQLGLIAGTRAALGAGIGLLVANRLTTEQRQAAGWALVGIGIATTLPLVAEVLSQRITKNEPARAAARGSNGRTHHARTAPA